MDVNTKKLKKNAFRVTKERGLTASRVRVPGGHLDAKYLSMIQEIAETYGDGSVHMTVRQGFEIPGIRYEDMDKAVSYTHLDVYKRQYIALMPHILLCWQF